MKVLSWIFWAVYTVWLVLNVSMILGAAVWRFICLFRKKGSCSFRKCPFRKSYYSGGCVYFPGSGCTKCPPTPEEEGSIEYMVEQMVEAEKREKKEKRLAGKR